MSNDFPLDAETIAALERAMEATQAAQAEEDTYNSLFAPPQPDPLSDEDRATYEALYGPGTGGDAA
jgi:hypothetical protein